MAETGRPKIAETPLELLTKPIIEPGLMNKYYTPVVAGFLGFTAVCTGNWASKRPALSGIQKHIIWGAVGVALGFFFDWRSNKKLAARDAIYRHYIELHPEDFPPYERKLYKDVFEPWFPIR